MARRPDPAVRDRLLDAARLEFARRGLVSARVEDIARRADVSKGAFYLHFASKEAAFDEVVLRLMGAIEDQARRRREAEERFSRAHGGDRGPAAREAQLAFETALDVEMLELLWRHRHVLPVIEGAGGPRYLKLAADLRSRLRSFTAARIRERQASGSLRADFDAEVVALLVVGAYEDFARRMADLAEPPDFHAWSRSLLVILYEGMLPRHALAPPRGRVRR